MSNSHHESPVARLLAKLPDAKRSGKGWQARCPAHEDRQPSLSIAEGDNGGALVNCFAGCSAQAIAQAVGLTLADLMPPSDRTTRRPGHTHNATRKPDKPAKTFASDRDAIASMESRLGRPSRLWTYHNAQGEPVGVVVRWDKPKGKKTIRPVSLTAGGWIIGTMPAPKPLYAQPDLLAAPAGARVYVCEGEKAADATRALGLLATTSPHGSNSAGKADWSPLARFEVVILPDEGDAGERYAQDVADMLAKLTPAPPVKVVRLPGLPEGGDMADFIEMRDGDAKAIKTEVEALADQAPTLEATPADNKPAPLPKSRRAKPVLTCMADVEPREIAWLWPGRIPLGRLTLLAGRPGEGKSFLTADFAARVTLGQPWPDGSPCPAGNVLLLSAEDDPGDTTRPRLDAHNADLSRVHLLSAASVTDDDGEERQTVVTLADVRLIEDALREIGGCRLIVIDPIGSYFGSGSDSYKDNEVRAVLAPIAQLAERYGAAVLVVAHVRKSAGVRADDIVLGSRAFTGLARAVWHLTRDHEDKRRRLLLPGKNNLSAQASGMAFTIAGDPACLQWYADALEMDADEALADEQGGPQQKPGPEAKARDAAAGWLAELLRHGGMKAGAIQDEAKAAGYSWATVRRAKDELGITPRKQGLCGGWWWSLPEGAQGGQGGLEPERLRASSINSRVSADFEPEHLRENDPLKAEGAQVAEPEHLRDEDDAEEWGEL